MGSELHKLREARGGGLSRLARSYVQEALLPIPEIHVLDVVPEETGFDTIRLYITLEISQNTYMLEVDAA